MTMTHRRSRRFTGESGFISDHDGLADDAARVATQLCRAAMAVDWRGPDPYDGLWWEGWPQALVRRRRGRQLIVQAHARSPIDFRPLYRRAHPRISKTLALFGATASRLHRRTGSDEHAALAFAALDRLCCESTSWPAWSYPFPVQTRWSFYPANAPNVVATSFAALALHEGAAILGVPAWAERAHAAAEWVSDSLWNEPRGWFAYHPTATKLIHNANLLGARACWTILNDSLRLRQKASRAVAATLRAQRSDGAFPYGDGAGLEWLDSFHTGYVLQCLTALRELASEAPPAIERAASHYVRSFFGDNGEAHLRARRHTQDAHSAGTALTTLSEVSTVAHIDVSLLRRIVSRTLTTMIRHSGPPAGQAPTAYVIHRRYRLGTARAHYPRWCDAHVALGFATFAARPPAAPDKGAHRTNQNGRSRAVLADARRSTP